LERIADVLATSDVTSPCKCAGSVMFIHVACLKEWIKAKGSISCEICSSLYNQEWIVWAFERNYIKYEIKYIIILLFIIDSQVMRKRRMMKIMKIY
jgi:E3 ubiquitin-protein ligase DOA10